MTRRSALRNLALGLGLTTTTRRGYARGPGDLDPGMLEIRVDDEFGPLKSVIVHDACNARDVDPCEIEDRDGEDLFRTHPEMGVVTGELVRKEMAAFLRLLARFKVEMVAPLPIENALCQLFTRDPSFAVGKTWFLGRLADEHRFCETLGLEAIRRRVPSPVILDGEGVQIEGGDVMVLDGGKLVLVGTHKKTNEAGFRLLADRLGPSGVEVVRVPHARLHLDCVLAPLPNGKALIRARGLPKQSQAVLKNHFKALVPLDRYEASRYLAANLLWLDPENVVSGTRTRHTNGLLKSMGYHVHALDFTNVKNMWGSFRCVTCPLKRG